MIDIFDSIDVQVKWIFFLKFSFKGVVFLWAMQSFSGWVHDVSSNQYEDGPSRIELLPSSQQTKFCYFLHW